MVSKVLHLKDYYDFLGDDGKDPTVEIYLPFNMDEMNRQNQKRPCMLICPGGAYIFCSQRESEAVALHFLPEGFNVFVLKYSTAPNRFPSQVREVAAVMELIYKNSEEWNCDTEKIAIMGFSAGGHLAAHYTNMYACKEVREVFPESKAVNASVLSYPVITADADRAHTGSFENLVGHYPLTEEEMDYFSCERLVSEKTPPTFLWHTANDACVPIMNTVLYSQALAKNKIPFEVHIYPSGWHGLATSDKQTVDGVNADTDHVSAWLPAVKKWLKFTFEL